MHFSASICTVFPTSLTWLAPVGQTLMHGALSQWLQRSEKNVIASFGNVPLTSARTRARRCPGGTPFSMLQATTQSWHPMHCRVSITIPKRATMVSSGDFL
jgi:hypothetical protein